MPFTFLLKASIVGLGLDYVYNHSNTVLRYRIKYALVYSRRSRPSSSVLPISSSPGPGANPGNRTTVDNLSTESVPTSTVTSTIGGLPIPYYMDYGSFRPLLIVGPMHSGKSTLLQQIALDYAQSSSRTTITTTPSPSLSLVSLTERKGIDGILHLYRKFVNTVQHSSSFLLPFLPNRVSFFSSTAPESSSSPVIRDVPIVNINLGSLTPGKVPNTQDYGCSSNDQQLYHDDLLRYHRNFNQCLENTLHQFYTGIGYPCREAFIVRWWYSLSNLIDRERKDAVKASEKHRQRIVQRGQQSIDNLFQVLVDIRTNALLSDTESLSNTLTTTMDNPSSDNSTGNESLGSITSTAPMMTRNTVNPRVPLLMIENLSNLVTFFESTTERYGGGNDIFATFVRNMVHHGYQRKNVRIILTENSGKKMEYYGIHLTDENKLSTFHFQDPSTEEIMELLNRKGYRKNESTAIVQRLGTRLRPYTILFTGPKLSSDVLDHYLVLQETEAIDTLREFFGYVKNYHEKLDKYESEDRAITRNTRNTVQLIEAMDTLVCNHLSSTTTITRKKNSGLLPSPPDSESYTVAYASIPSYIRNYIRFDRVFFISTDQCLHLQYPIYANVWSRIRHEFVAAAT